MLLVLALLSLLSIIALILLPNLALLAVVALLLLSLLSVLAILIVNSLLVVSLLSFSGIPFRGARERWSARSFLFWSLLQSCLRLAFITLIRVIGLTLFGSAGEECKKTGATKQCDK